MFMALNQLSDCIFIISILVFFLFRWSAYWHALAEIATEDGWYVFEIRYGYCRETLEM